MWIRIKSKKEVGVEIKLYCDLNARKFEYKLSGMTDLRSENKQINVKVDTEHLFL